MPINPVVEALALLTPFDIDVAKVRVGPNTDGGYIFADIIRQQQTVISYGISTEYRFDAEMAERGHKVFMFDHTIEAIQVTHENMIFAREGIAGVSAPGASLYNLKDHLIRNNITDTAMILKIDVEGAEYESLNAVPDEILGRFEQIVIEVHGINRIGADVRWREGFVAMFRKLNRLFTLFHVHANNCDGADGLRILSGIPVSDLLELSYIKRSLCQRFPSRTLYPTALDYPNVPSKDKLLWFFPFMPTEKSIQDFGLCEERVELHEQIRVMGR